MVDLLPNDTQTCCRISAVTTKPKTIFTLNVRKYKRKMIHGGTAKYMKQNDKFCRIRTCININHPILIRELIF